MTPVDTTDGTPADHADNTSSPAESVAVDSTNAGPAPVDRASTDLADQLLKTARLLRHSTMRALEPLGLNPHQARTLRIVARHEPLRPSAVAQRLRITPRSATEVVDGLVKAGWVDRSPDPQDRRATLLTLSATGRPLLEQVNQIRAGVHTNLLSQLNADDRAQLARILDLLVVD